MRKALNTKGEAAGGVMAVLGVGIGVILLILLYGVFATLGAKVNSDLSSTFTAGSDAAKVSGNVSTGLVTAGQNTPTIASVGGFVIVIALLALVAAYAFGAFR